MTIVRICLGVACLALVACAESTAEVNAPDAFDTRTADPEFIRSAEEALDTYAGGPEDGWRVGVVIAERGDKYDWEAAVLTHEGVEAVELAINCDSDSDGIQESSIDILVDPGDLIEWSREGDDNRLCSDELRIIRKAAA